MGRVRALSGVSTYQDPHDQRRSAATSSRSPVLMLRSKVERKARLEFLRGISMFAMNITKKDDTSGDAREWSAFALDVDM